MKSIYALCLLEYSLLYNSVLVSAVQQSESVIHIHIAPLLYISFPFRSLKSIEFPVL